MSLAEQLTLQFSQPDRILKLAGAHNPLGARLAEAAGFDGIWASSFEIATSRGVPDADVLTWRELLAVAASLAQAVALPVVADCATGFGGPDDIQELSAAYAAAGIAAICVEDAGSPRKNSLLAGEHELADMHEFAAKVRAAKRAAGSMLVFARVQSLVAERGQSDALARAHSYAAAGADAIVIHSRSTEPDEILRFLAAWDGATPIVLIPTTYPQLTISQMRSTGQVRMAIYANHGLRAAISAMKRAFRQIIAEESSQGVETWIANLDEAFALQMPAGGPPS
jgi:phosphoenolpyruvate phosphomutase